MRKELQTNLQYVDLLNEWNPFNLTNGGYDTEIADTIQAIYELDDCDELAKRIQSIYDFSFERIIPLEKCLKIAKELLVIKANDACSI
ncbi:hypothetical protein COJ96_09885 [Bacillus sp. AFS073361]|uniref:DUF1871 family protein n=1 Tax=Bacillaceae TaxID=186817 RepID=UPI000BF67366|nr:DUF1871 family protein [Bacillus sp. AFS073361]PFP29451.1 hypothetical protein COJ96_09885 [Bacillus sp. AFS073361]